MAGVAFQLFLIIHTTSIIIINIISICLGFVNILYIYY